MSTLTSPTLPKIGRPADRQDLIVEEIRHQIVVGFLPPGSRLPTRSEIEEKYGAGANTVQRALDRLKSDGFIQSSGRNGTHVSHEPPHLTRYAVVFPHVPLQDEEWLRFWTALGNEAIKLQHNENRKLPLYYGIDHGSPSEGYSRLLEDVLGHRLAGIIFAASPHNLVGSPILEMPGIPRVGIMSAWQGLPLPAINPDVNTFLDKAVAYLQERGCQRIAFLHPSGMDVRCDYLRSKIEAHGMTTRPFWNLSVHLAAPQAARNIADLLMRVAPGERPDGLIIGDDNLAEYATAGLVAARVRVPEELKVVAHCNFPYQTPNVLAVKQLGFDAREVLHQAIAHIDAMRRGESVPAVTNVTARFEDELTGNHS